MICGLILAGGQGSRLGGVDKAFLALHGQPLIEHVLLRLAPQVAPLAISANGILLRFAAYGLPVLPDAPAFAGKGPLAGVAAGLAWAQGLGADALLTIPVDTPFLPADFCQALQQAPAVACHAGRQHHLAALWKVDFLPALEAFLREPGSYKVRDALALMGARAVDFAGEMDPFLNINTTEDLTAAQNQ
jgi:molybdopterin-guanine dinucleotide biosynthesis protein A